MSEQPDKEALDQMREQLEKAKEKLVGDAAKPVEEQRRDPDEVVPPPAIR
jgi:hypothetical protein